jgi:hypothetical protein
MQAYKIAVTITEERTVKLPDDVPAGPAEVIVLVVGRKPSPAEEAAPSGNEALFHLLDTLQASGHARRSKEDIDAELAEERASWEDRG